MDKLIEELELRLSVNADPNKSIPKFHSEIDKIIRSLHGAAVNIKKDYFAANAEQAENATKKVSNLLSEVDKLKKSNRSSDYKYEMFSSMAKDAKNLEQNILSIGKTLRSVYNENKKQASLANAMADGRIKAEKERLANDEKNNNKRLAAIKKEEKAYIDSLEKKAKLAIAEEKKQRDSLAKLMADGRVKAERERLDSDKKAHNERLAQMKKEEKAYMDSLEKKAKLAAAEEKKQQNALAKLMADGRIRAERERLNGDKKAHNERLAQIKREEKAYMDSLERKAKAQLLEDRRNQREQESKDSNGVFSRTVRAAGVIGRFATARFALSPMLAGLDLLRNGFSNAVKGAVELQKGLTSMRAITKSSDADISAYKDTIVNLGNEFNISSSAANELILNLARMGVESKSINKVAHAAGSLSASLGGDINKASEVLVTTMNAFGISFDKADEMATKMVKTLNSAALDMSKFSTILSYVSSSADATGVSFDKASAMIAVLANNGLKASQIGTSLREIFSSLANKGTDLSSVMSELKDSNMTYADATELTTKRAANALTVLVNKWGDVEAAQRAAMLDPSTAAGQAAIQAQYSVWTKWGRQFTGLFSSVKSSLSNIGASSDKEAFKDAFAEARLGKGGATIQDILSHYVSGELSSMGNKARDGLYSGSYEEQTSKYRSFLQSSFNKLAETGAMGGEGSYFDETKDIDKYVDMMMDKFENNLQEALLSEVSEKVRVELSKKTRAGDKFDRETEAAKLTRKYASEMGMKYADTGMLQQAITSALDYDIPNEATRTEAFSEWQKQLSTMRSNEGKKNLLEVEAYDKAKEKADALDKKWTFTKKGQKLSSKKGISYIKTSLGDLSPERRIQSALKRMQGEQALATGELEGTTDEAKRAKIQDAYWNNTRHLMEIINVKTIEDYLDGNLEIVEGLRKQAEDEKKSFMSQWKKKYGADLEGADARNELTAFNREYEELINLIDEYKISGMASVYSSNKKALSISASVMKKNKPVGGIVDYATTEELMGVVNGIQKGLTDISEMYSSGKTTFGTARSAYKKIAGNISSASAMNETRYKKEIGSINQRKLSLNELLNKIDSGEDVSREMSEYGVSSVVDLRDAVLKDIESMNKAGKSSTASYLGVGRSLSTALGKVNAGSSEVSKDKKLAIVDTIKEGTDAIYDVYSTLQSRMLQSTLDRIDAEIEAERNKSSRLQEINQGSLELGLISQSEYSERKKQIDDELYEKENQMLEKRFEIEKKAELTQARINFAQTLATIAINAITAESKKGLLGLASAPVAIAAYTAIATAQFAAQSAAISKKRYIPTAKKYADGGLIEGASHSNGGVPFIVGNQIQEYEGGEFVVNKTATAKHLSTLMAINNDSLNTDVHYYSGLNGIVNRMSGIESKLSKPVRAYIVSSDIGKDNKFRRITNSKTSI